MSSTSLSLLTVVKLAMERVLFVLGRMLHGVWVAGTNVMTQFQIPPILLTVAVVLC